MGPEAGTIPAAEARYAGYREVEPGKWVVDAFLVGSPPAGCEPRATLYRSGQQFTSATGPFGSQVRIDLDKALDPSVTWTVQLAWVSGGSPGPASPPVEVPALAPLLRSVAADATVRVAWGLAPGPPYPTGVQLLLKGGGKTSGEVINGAEEVRCSPEPPLKEGVVYSATVAALRGLGEGPPSEPVLVPYVRTSIASTVYDGETLTVTWAGADPAKTTGCRIELLRGAVQVGEFPGTGGEASSPVELDPAAAYQVRLRWLAGRGSGPAGPAAPVISAAPVLETAEVLTGGGEVRLTWAPPAGSVTGYVAVFRREGAPDVQVPLASGATSPAKVALPAAVSDVLGRATVALRAIGAGGTGPPSEALPLILGAPALEAVEYDLSAVTVRAAPVPGPVDGYETRASWDPTRVIASPGPSATFPVSSPPTVASRVEIAARRGAGLGPSDGPGGGQLVLGAPAISACAFDGVQLTVEVAPSTKPSGTPTGYRVELLRGDVVVERAELPLPAGKLLSLPVGRLEESAVAYSVRVRTRAGVSLGPAAEAPVTLAAPAVSSVTVDPAGGNATVTWSEVQGATGYVLQAYLDGAPAGDPIQTAATEKQATLKTPPAAGQDLAVSVRAIVTVSGVPCKGPPGPRIAVLTAAPEIVAVEFDGGSVTVGWRPLAGAGGYAVSVVGGTPAAVFASGSASAGATSLRLAPAQPIPTDGYRVAVQARRDSSSGVAAKAALFQPGLYVKESGRGLTILRTKSEKLEAEALSAHLPALGKAPLTGLPIEPPQTGEAKPPFTLAENTDPASKTTLPYLLTIQAGALSFDASRANLKTTYRTLLREAEAAGAGPKGIFALQQAISRLMPQTFAETLYYAYGLSPTSGYVDLRPGMILRVAAPGFDLTAVDSVPAPEAWSTGYAPGAAIDLAIDDYLSGEADPQWRVGFDAFLASLAASGALEVPAPEDSGPSPSKLDVVETGGADAADLFYPEFRNPFYRLLIPASVQAAGKPTNPRTSEQFAVASAPKWAQIDAGATASDVWVAYFRGRAVLRPCIRVEVGGRERVVPVGTTVGNLLDGLGRRPPSAARALAGLSLGRSPGPAVLDPGAPYDAGAVTRVNLDWFGLVTSPLGADALSLPLLHGDRLELGDQG